MNATLEPTPEMWIGNINGVDVPCRIWKGHTAGGIPIEAYVLSITPDNDADVERLRAELPDYMTRSREAFVIGPEGVSIITRA